MFHSLSLCQAGEWSEWCLPAVPRLWRGGGWKGFWVWFLTEENECVGQADSDPPGVAAAGSQWRGGQSHTAQTTTRGEMSPSEDTERFKMCLFLLWKGISDASVSMVQVFLVRKSAPLQRKILSVRLKEDQSATISNFPVKESQYSK